MPRAEIHPSNIRYLRSYDPQLVQILWEDVISLDLSTDDPYYASNDSQYNHRIDAAKKEIKRAKKMEKSDYVP